MPVIVNKATILPVVLRCGLLLPLCWGWAMLAQAQFTHQDCFTATPLCGPVFVQNNHGPTVAEGLMPNEINPSTCLGGEDNSQWYVFTVQGPASSMSVSLVPTSPTADFNFAIYNLTNATCASVFSNPTLLVSCNSSITPGATGATGASPFTSQGPAGTPFNAQFPVTNGQTYVLYVSNANGAIGGYTLNINTLDAATTIVDTTPPSIDSIGSGVECKDDTVWVYFSEPILCSSVTSADFTITGPGGFSSSVILAYGQSCTFDPFSQESAIALQLGTPIGQNGTYQVNITGSVIDNCGNTLSGVSIPFVVAQDTIRLDSVGGLSCGDNSLTLFFSDSVACGTLQPADFSFTDYLGNQITILGVESAPCLTGGPTTLTDSLRLFFNTGLNNINLPYEIKIVGSVANDCGTVLALDSANVIISDTLIANIVPAQVEVCYSNPFITLDASGSSGSPNLGYIWSPQLYLDNPYSSTPTAQVSDTITYAVRVFNGTCLSAPDSVRVNFISAPQVNVHSGTDLTICIGQSTQIDLVANQNTTVVWPGTALSGTSVVVNPAVTTTYNVVPSVNGCIGDTLPIVVAVVDRPVGSIAMSDTSFCAYGDTVLIEFVGSYNPINDIPTWDFGTGTVVSGSGYGPYEVVWFQDEIGQIELSITGLGCTTDFAQGFVSIGQAVLAAGPDRYRCENGPLVTINAQVQSQNACAFTWTPAASLNSGAVLTPTSFTNITTDYIVTAVCGGCPALPDTMTMIVTPRPVVSYPPVVSACEGGTILLPASVSSGAGPYAFHWIPSVGLNNPFILNPVAVASQDQLYQMLATDSLGCRSDTVNMLLQIEEKPIVDAGPDQTICKGGAGVYLNGIVVNNNGSAYNYQWSPVAGLTSPTQAHTYAQPSQTTTYFLQVTSTINGCTNLQTALDTLAYVTVYVQPRPVADAGLDRVICQFDSVQLGGIPTGGGPDYTYVWTPNIGLSDTAAQTPMASPPFSTTYYLTVASNGCLSIADTVNVTVDPRPTLSILTPDTSICPNDEFSISVSLQGVPGVPQVVWTPALGLSDSSVMEPIASPLATVQYILSLFTASCINPTRDTLNVVVRDVPVVNANTTGNQILLCLGDSLQMPAQVTFAGTFNTIWSPAQFLTDPNIIQTSVFPTQPTAFVLSAFANGCEVRDTAEVYVSDSLSAVALVDRPVICQGEQVTLSTTTPAPANYFWSPTAEMLDTVGPVVTAGPTATTAYTLLVERDGCSDTDTVIVTVLPTPVAEIDFTVLGGCQGHTVQFFSNAFQTHAWQWSFGDGGVSNSPDPEHTYANAGTYIVTLLALGDGGCTNQALAQKQVSISTRANADFSLKNLALPETLYLPNATVSFLNQSVGGQHYLWQFGDGQMSTDANPSHTYELPGQYIISLTVTDSGGCVEDTSLGELTVLMPEISIPNVFTPNGDNINDVWLVRYEGSERFEAYVYDRWGNVVYSSNDASAWWRGTNTNGAEVPAGQYFYNIEIGEKTYSGGVTLLK